MRRPTTRRGERPRITSRGFCKVSIRRVPSTSPFTRRYESEFAPTDGPRRRGADHSGC